MPTELVRTALSGPTMGTRFSAVFYAPSSLDRDAAGKALAEAVGQVDREMSTWKPDSALMRFNAAPVGEWIVLPERLLEVIEAGLEVGRASSGAFDIGVLEHVQAFGFHGAGPEAAGIARLSERPHVAAHEVVVVDRPGGGALKREACAIDLSGIAKGYGVDRLADTLTGMEVGHFLVSIDGELRAFGGKPEGSPWRVAVEQPDPEKRDVAGVVELHEGAIATSGNYRHRRRFGGRSYSHTIDGRTGQPVGDDVYSATVRAPTCMQADAWATVVMVLGEANARPLLAARGLSALTIGPEAAR